MEDIIEKATIQQALISTKPRKFTISGRPRPTISTKKRYTSKQKIAKSTTRRTVNIVKKIDRKAMIYDNRGTIFDKFNILHLMI